MPMTITARRMGSLLLLCTLAACSSDDGIATSNPGGPRATPSPTPESATPTPAPSGGPTQAPTLAPTQSPTQAPTQPPATSAPTGTPTASPTAAPTGGPGLTPTPTTAPSVAPSPTTAVSPTPTTGPTTEPSPTPTPGAAGQVDLLAPTNGGTVETSSGFSCVVCDVSNAVGALSTDPEDFATAMLSVGLLSALENEGTGSDELTLTVRLPLTLDPATPFPLDAQNPSAGGIHPDHAGFVVSFPDSALISLSLLPTISISVLNDNEVVGGPTSYGYGFFEFLALDSPAQDINNARVFLGADADAPYNAIRIAFTASVVDALLNINVHQTVAAGTSGSIEGDF